MENHTNYKRYMLQDSGDYDLVSQWTASDSVQVDSEQTLDQYLDQVTPESGGSMKVTGGEQVPYGQGYTPVNVELKAENSSGSNSQGASYSTDGITYSTNGQVHTSLPVSTLHYLEGITSNVQQQIDNIVIGESGVTSITFLYAKNSDPLNPPPESADWSETKPDISTGEYLWQKTTVNYAQGNPTVNYINITHSDNSGKVIISASVYYLITTEAGQPSDTDPRWTETFTQPGDGEYLWTRTVTSYTDGTTSKVYSVAWSGPDGKLIDHQEYEYALSDSGKSVPSSGWSPVWPGSTQDIKGKWVWTRTTTYYTEGGPGVTTQAVYQGEDGAQGPPGPQGPQGPQGSGSTTIDKITTYYCLTASKPSNTPPGTPWLDYQPVMTQTAFTNNHTYYHCDVTELSDGNVVIGDIVTDEAYTASARDIYQMDNNLGTIKCLKLNAYGRLCSAALKIDGSTLTSSIQLAADDLNFIADGNMMLKSSTFGIDSTYFKVDKNTGSMTSTGGTIGGWSINSSAIASGSITATSTSTKGTYIGAGTATDGSTSRIKQYYDPSHYMEIYQGKLTATGADIKGTITAESGKIGNWNIDTSLHANASGGSGPTSVGQQTNGTYIGVDGFWQYGGSTASIKLQSGVLTANNVDLTGKITATSGKIGGWSISNGELVNTQSSGLSASISPVNGITLSAPNVAVSSHKDIVKLNSGIYGYSDTKSIFSLGIADGEDISNDVRDGWIHIFRYKNNKAIAQFDACPQYIRLAYSTDGTSYTDRVYLNTDGDGEFYRDVKVGRDLTVTRDVKITGTLSTAADYTYYLPAIKMSLGSGELGHILLETNARLFVIVEGSDSTAGTANGLYNIHRGTSTSVNALVNATAITITTGSTSRIALKNNSNAYMTITSFILTGNATYDF